MTTVGVHRQEAGFAPKWAQFLEEHGARVKWLDLRGPDPLGQARECDGIMWHWAHNPDFKQSARVILHVIETELRIPVFPDLRTSWHFDNKIAQAYLLDACGIPTPRTWIFWNRDAALQWAAEAAYPVVFKLASGASSANVHLVRDERRARKLIRGMFSRSGMIPMVYVPPGAGPGERVLREARNFALRCLAAPLYVFLKRYPPLPREFWAPEKNYALFQEYIGGNAFDTRITVIGDRAFGFRRMNRAGDFRASGSGNIDADPSKIDERCVRSALDYSRRIAAQSVAFDFLFREESREPVATEISYGFADWAVQQCPGHWDSGLRWWEGRMWPQEAHIVDFLRRIESRKASGAA